MHVIRLRKRIESETLHLPELKDLIGKTVEILVREEAGALSEPLETPATFFGRMPPRPRTSPAEQGGERRRLEEMAQSNPALAAVLEVAAAGGPDVEAIIGQRAGVRLS
jgi:hypothetical protein